MTWQAHRGVHIGAVFAYSSKVKRRAPQRTRPLTRPLEHPNHRQYGGGVDVRSVTRRMGIGRPLQEARGDTPGRRWRGGSQQLQPPPWRASSPDLTSLEGSEGITAVPGVIRRS